MTATSETVEIPGFQASTRQLDPRPPRTLWRDAWTRLSRSKLSVICVVVTVLYVLTALATFLPVFDRTSAAGESVGLIWDNVGPSNAAPRRGPPAVWFGTDIFGRSVFWRTLFGTRTALEITAGASILTIGIGLALGVVAGYFGGWVDELIVWLFSTISSIPWIVMVIALAYVLEAHAAWKQWASGIGPIIVALGLTDWVGLCRLVRGEVLSLRDRDYVMAARAVGLSHGRILSRHVVPNVMHIVIITFSLGAVGYVQAEVVLAFLGLGVTNRPSWGRMIDDAKADLLQGVWWQVTAATAAIFIICLALNVLGDALRDALDPRLRGVD